MPAVRRVVLGAWLSPGAAEKGRMRVVRSPVLKVTGIGDLINAVRYARAVRRVRELMRLDAAGLERFQQERLREIVRYAYENVEVYHRKWQRAGIRPDDIGTLTDLKKLPLTTKEDLRRASRDEILSREFKPENCHVLTSSGSTGTPVRVYVDEDKALIDMALSLPRYMAGLPPVTASSVIRDFLLRRHIRYMSIVVKKEYLYHEVFWTMKHTVVDSLDTPDVHIRAINAKKPAYLYSYPSVIRNVCIRAREKRIVLHQPQLVMVCGEVVDGPLRDMARRTFGTDLINVYGSTELGHIASECASHEGLHIFSCKVLMELLDEAGRDVPVGQTGRVVVTDLFSRATPIIRYSGLGDYAIRGGQCSCGRPLPLLARVEGRVVDTVVLPDGQTVHPYSLTLALEDVPHLSKFQIRQERPDYLRVLLVKDNVPEAQGVSFAPDGDVGRMILGRFNRILKNQANVDLVPTDDIPTQPGSRKYPTVVSLVNAR